MKHFNTLLVAAMIAVPVTGVTIGRPTFADNKSSTTTPSQAQTAQQMPMQQMQHMKGNMENMRALMARIHATTDMRERQKLMTEHRSAMMQQMQMMHGMMGGQMGMGMKGGRDAQSMPGHDMHGPGMQGQAMMMQRMDMMQGMMEQMMEHMSVAEHEKQAAEPAKKK